MLSKLASFLGKEIREALPATLFFLVLFHLVGLTKAVVLEEYELTALRSAGATLGALVVAKAILVVDALPFWARLSVNGATRLLGKTLVYGVVVLLFRLVEELVPLATKHGGLEAGLHAMAGETSWPTFGVLLLWLLAGLAFYAAGSELLEALGAKRARELFFGGEARGD